MSSYVLNTATGTVTRDDGVVCAPAQSAEDPDFVGYNAWVNAGNEPTIVDIAPITEADYIAAVQSALDGAAQAKGYDSILSATSYASSSDATFGPEGKAFSDWRDAVWRFCNTQLALVESGQLAAPTIDGLLAGLPALTLPS